MVTRIESHVQLASKSVDVNQKRKKGGADGKGMGGGDGKLCGEGDARRSKRLGNYFKMLREFFSEWMLGSRWK